jgi:hypothetical protein
VIALTDSKVVAVGNFAIVLASATLFIVGLQLTLVYPAHILINRPLQLGLWPGITPLKGILTTFFGLGSLWMSWFLDQRLENPFFFFESEGENQQ